jgi:hypothetical protein
MQFKCNSADSLVNSDMGGASCCVRWLYVAKLVTHEGTTAHMGIRYQMIVTSNWNLNFKYALFSISMEGHDQASEKESGGNNGLSFACCPKNQ